MYVYNMEPLVIHNGIGYTESKSNYYYNYMYRLKSKEEGGVANNLNNNNTQPG